MSEEQTFTPPTPGPEHELLKPFEGTFTAEVKMWWGPGEPSISTGKMVNSFQVGGLYLHQEYKGDQTEGPFPNFEGRGYWGFNTTSGEYEGSWIDTASTQMATETGNVDKSGKVWEMTSEFQSPMGGPKMQKRAVFTVIDENSHLMESYITLPGQEEMKNMEIKYSRV